MSNELVLVPFHQDNVVCVKDENGNGHVAVKPFCENLGISNQGQQKKLEKDPKFNCQLMLIVAEDGKLRELFCIAVDDIPGWLFSINANRVKPEHRSTVLRYQRECFQVLKDYWTKGVAINPRAVASGELSLDAITDAFSRVWDQKIVEFLPQLQGLLLGQAIPDRPIAPIATDDTPFALSTLFNSMAIPFPAAAHYAQEFGKVPEVKALARGKMTKVINDTTIEVNAYYRSDWSQLHKMASEWIKSGKARAMSTAESF